MRHILSILVLHLFAISAHGGYLNFPIDDLQNLKLSSQIVEKIFTDTPSDSFYLENPEFIGIERVKIDVSGSKLDFKNYTRALKALMVKEKLAENDFQSAFRTNLISLNRQEAGDWDIEVKGYTVRKKITFKVTNLSGGETPFGISIILPTFNRITECTACVLLLKARILAPKSLWEVIVVDDGCTDGTGAYLTDLFKSKGFENFRVIYTDKEPGKYRNGGWARNAGVKAARYSHVATCDCDVYHMSDPVTPTLNILSENKETIVTGIFYCVYGPQSTFEVFSDQLVIKKFHSQEFAAGWLAVIRSRYINIGGNSEKIMHWGWEDIDIMERLKRTSPLPIADSKVCCKDIIYCCAYERDDSYKVNRDDLNLDGKIICDGDKSDIRNADKPDWGKFIFLPKHVSGKPDFSKVN